VTVEGCEVLAQVRQVEKPIDAAEQMVRQHMLIQVEGIKLAAVFSHHAGALPPPLLLTKTLKTQTPFNSLSREIGPKGTITGVGFVPALISPTDQRCVDRLSHPIKDDDTLPSRPSAESVLRSLHMKKALM
jgi:hypothetical protein